MADNFAVIVELNENEDAKQYTISGGKTVSLSKGDLLKLSGDNAVSVSAANSDIYAGVAAADNDGLNGNLTIGVHVPGALNKFDMKCGAAVPLGALVSLSGANLIKPCTAAELLTGDQIGKAMEAGEVNEVIVVLS